MPGFYVFPAGRGGNQVTFIPNAVDINDAVKRACKRTEADTGTFAVVPADTVTFVKVESGDRPLTVTPAANPKPAP